jgi:uncharacterized protein with HEPN domain
MSPRDLVYVGHMLDTATSRLALTHLVQIIGEAGRHVSREFTDGHPEIQWADIVGMRHKVVHDYLGVDEDIVGQVVTGDLPKLVASLERLVAASDCD